MIDKPLYQNPLGGGADINTSGAINPIGGSGGFLGDGSMEQVPIDPIMQGFQNSEFRKKANNMQQDAVNFKYDGKDMMMNSSMAGAFKQYLDSIGKGDLYDSGLQLSGELATVNPITLGNDFMESPDNNAMIPGDPGLYAPPTMKTPGLPPPSTFVEGEIFPIQTTVPGDSPFQTTGQYLTGPNESNNVLETLKNIEQGIASLGANYGQGNNMNQSSNYGDFSNFGIGNFYPPYGGMYG